MTVIAHHFLARYSLARSTCRPLWNPFRRSRGYARPTQKITKRKRDRLWFWPLTEKVLNRRERWFRRQIILQTIETKSWPSKAWRWRNFSPGEMGCRHCAAVYHWPEFMDPLQHARDQVGRPFRILSAHRCRLHNARVGGAPRSEHLRLAVDIALAGHDHWALYAAMKQAGFTGFGFYETFLHADMGRSRQWFGSPKAKLIWKG